VGELALVPRAAARDAAGNDFPPLGDVGPQAPDVFVVNEADFVDAELADLPPPEAAALDWLGNGGNG